MARGIELVFLHSIRLRGFKTFARPTELTFEPGVTVIIGPNGSGKSNIADAVLWVLGEQSPGNLRGRTMQDVIFSGPGGRRSSAVAEVSLVFDNGSGALPFDCGPLEVTRRLNRDGGSEYRLNGSGCRLLDVQDLVGGMGLGREMHSVISQGKVEELLHSTPEARRAMVEEAAGLGRFKKRRERAQAKLERTRQNLLRVGDVEREVKTALRPLRRQVAAAERFAVATEDWALAKTRLVLHDLGGVLASRAETQKLLETADARRAEIERTLSELRREKAEEEQRFNAALEERERLGSAHHRAGAAAERLEARATALRQRLARLEGETDRARRRLDLARSEVESLSTRADEVSGPTPDEARLLKVAGWAQMLRGALEESLPAYSAVVEEEEGLKDAVFELETARSRAFQDREFLRREVEERSRVGAELEALAREAAARLEQSQAERVRLQSDLDRAMKAALEAQADLRAAAEGREEARAAADEASRVEAGLAEESAGLEARQAVLADLLARREGASPGARELVAAHEDYVPLAEVLVVEPGFERAVAAALGPVAGAVLVPASRDLDRVFDVEGAVEAVSGSIQVPRADRSAAAPVGTRDLWDVVSGPEAALAGLRRLIPPTAVVEGGERLDAGRFEGHEGTWRLVSRDGELLQAGVHAARRREIGAETLMTARNELAAVSRARDGLSAKQDAARETSAHAAASAAEAEECFRGMEERLHQAERLVVAGRGELDLQERRLEEAGSQCVELQGRRDREADLSERLLADLDEVEESTTGMEAELEQARAALRALQGRVETMRQAVAGLEEKKSQAALVEVRLRERCRALESERLRLRNQRASAELEASRCERRVGLLDRYLPVVGSLLEVTERLVEGARVVAGEMESVVEAVRTRTEGAARVMRDRGGEEAGLQREHDALVSRLTDLRVQEALLEERRTLLEDELSGLKRRHLSPRRLTAADVEGEDAESLTAAVERAERRREHIGPVNPLAEQECAEMEERAAFLAEQRRDLEASINQLQEVIDELNDHIECTFGEIFKAAREHFQGVIASVFPGAKGTLKLTEPKSPGRRPTEDIEGGLEEPEEEKEAAGGIALEVKLPNKAPRSLSLLSGGEKAMTAIAFLFSLFLARPCPFYILDEVEASLDDINIRRFLTLVRKHRDKAQFIVITHQRQTMEIADTLYGVALESDGTSRVLSRRLTISKGA
ncbi:MAG: chromosome segregation protein SMC [Actinobacteria bacterium]|nr:chromosome segregation protein SMC [Actinomycetota bacterium]